MKKIQDRTQQNRQLLLEQIKKIPIVQVACEKVGISRSTYYRWRETDKEFASKADKFLREGIAFVNDMAESQLISSIRNQNLTAVMYWLNHRHSAYSNKLEVTTNSHEKKTLSEEQQKLITRALEHANVLLKKGTKNEK